MRILEFHGRRIAVGLSWRLASHRDEIKPLLQQKEHQARVVYPSLEGVLLGSLPQPDKSGSPLYAGALLLALHRGALIIGEKLADGSYWLLGIQNGVPLPGQDQVCAATEVEKQLNTLRKALPGAPLYGSHPEAAEPLQVLFDGLKTADWRLAKMSTVSARRSQRLALALGVSVLFLMGAMYAVSQMQQETVLLATPQTQTKPPERMRVSADLSKLRQEYQQKVAREKQKYMTVPAIGALSQGWLSLLSSLPANTDGYELNELACLAHQCEAIRKATDTAEFGALNVRLAQAEGAEDVYKEALLLPEVPPTEHASISRQEWPAYKKALELHFRALGARFETRGVLKELTVDVPEGLKAEDAMSIGASQTVLITVSGYHNLLAVLDSLSKTPVLPGQLRLAVSRGQVSMLLEAEYVLAS